RVGEAGGVEDGRPQAELVRQGQQGKSQEILVPAHIVEYALAVITRPGGAPAQIIFQAQFGQQTDQVLILGQDAMVIAVPDERSVIMRGCQTAGLAAAFENLHGMARPGQPMPQGETQHARSDYADLQAATRSGEAAAAEGWGMGLVRRPVPPRDARACCSMVMGSKLFLMNPTRVSKNSSFSAVSISMPGKKESCGTLSLPRKSRGCSSREGCTPRRRHSPKAVRK